MKKRVTLFFLLFYCLSCVAELPVYYWQQPQFVNFGDYISIKLVERIVGEPVRLYKKSYPEKKLLAVGSIIYFANNDDVIWGTGTNGKYPYKESYNFTQLDVRAVRGPKTRQFLNDNWNLNCKEIYGDPALLFPFFFPEFVKSTQPSQRYIVIPHYSERKMFPKENNPHIVYPTDPWDEVIHKIIDSEFVISSSLHGIIIAEAYGIPARFLRVTETEPLLKYEDYYLGTNRPNFQYATSVEEALKMGGEPPFSCDLEQLYNAFPFDYWPNTEFKKPNFQQQL